MCSPYCHKPLVISKQIYNILFGIIDKIQPYASSEIKDMLL